MPRKKKSTNKSKLIRDFVAKNPDLKPAGVAAALSKKGTKISAQYVSVILSNDRRKNGSSKSSRRKVAKPARKTTPGGERSHSCAV